MITPDTSVAEFQIRPMTPAEAEIAQFDPSQSDPREKLTSLLIRHLINMDRYEAALLDANSDQRAHLEALMTASNNFVVRMALYYGDEVDFSREYLTAESEVIALPVEAKPIDEDFPADYTELLTNPGRVITPYAELGQNSHAWINR